MFSITLINGIRPFLRLQNRLLQTPVVFLEHLSKQHQTAYAYRLEKHSKLEDMGTKRSRLLYQSKKRGILENDILLGDFAEQMLEKMNFDELMRYDEIINGKHAEWDLYYFIAGRESLPKDLKDCAVFRMLQDFVTRKTVKANEPMKR